jgi:tRNA(Ile2) C34 agmatinyltransferase TiaS
MKENITICKYCGNEFQSKSETADICHKCYEKLPYVRQLVAIGRAIKRGTKK